MKNKFFRFLANLFPAQPVVPLGANIDTRPPEEKEKDYLHEEMEYAGAVAPQYGLKSDVQKIYPTEDQNATSSCVAHASTLMEGIERKRDLGQFDRLSKMFVYRHRINYPGEGMDGYDVGNILVNKGSCLYDSLPNFYSESEANQTIITNAHRNEAAGYKIKSFVSVVDRNNIDTLCQISTQGKPIMIFIFATVREWSLEYPDTLDNTTLGTATVRHAITILPNSGFMENGKKYLMIQDSSKFGGLSYRCLSQDFIAKRVYYAQYLTDLNIVIDPNKPKHTFTKVLKYGMSNEEVKWLQKCLAYEGLHPANACTGYFGGITLSSVNKFQNKYATEILIPLGLDKPTGIVGSATIAKLNQLFS